MKKDAKENGITLVALVVTIIVLLILAGVSLSLVLGDNGIITRAQDAVTKYKEAEAEEQWQMDNFMANYEGGDAYARALQQKGLSATTTENGYLAAEDAGDGKNVTLYHYDNNGNVTETETLEYAPEELFKFDAATNAITGINMDYGGDGRVYYEENKGVHLGDITGILVVPNKINGIQVKKVDFSGTKSDHDYITSAWDSGLYRIDTIILPNGVVEVSKQALYNCLYLKQILLPNTLEKIGNCAFHACSGLKYVTLPDSVTDLEDRAFCCSALRNFISPGRN